MSQMTADILRWVSLGLAGFVAAMTGMIVFHYARIRDRGRDRALPWHIILIGVSHLLLIVFASLEVANRLGQLPTWRIWVAIVALPLSVVALWLMNLHLRYERHPGK